MKPITKNPKNQFSSQQEAVRFYEVTLHSTLLYVIWIETDRNHDHILKTAHGRRGHKLRIFVRLKSPSLDAILREYKRILKSRLQGGYIKIGDGVPADIAEPEQYYSGTQSRRRQKD